MLEITESTPFISFVIPTLNEESNIRHTLQAIKEHAAGLQFEIIVCDHGSVDRTRDIAASEGAAVSEPDARTIAGLRNAGVERARGSILVFLDADVAITDEWARGIPDTLSKLADDPMLVTGSHCESLGGETMYDFWFEKLKNRQNAPYIATTHLIVSRALFDRIQGFNEKLVTGEDYDFCRRARLEGARILPDPSLRAIHRRLPKSLRDFIARERWHGLSDTRSLSSLLNSKVALASVVFLVCHFVLLVLLITAAELVWVPLLGIIGLLLISTKMKFGSVAAGGVKAFALFYFYYVGRGAAFFPQRERRWSDA